MVESFPVDYPACRKTEKRNGTWMKELAEVMKGRRGVRMRVEELCRKCGEQWACIRVSLFIRWSC